MWVGVGVVWRERSLSERTNKASFGFFENRLMAAAPVLAWAKRNVLYREDT